MNASSQRPWTTLMVALTMGVAACAEAPVDGDPSDMAIEIPDSAPTILDMEIDAQLPDLAVIDMETDIGPVDAEPEPMDAEADMALPSCDDVVCEPGQACQVQGNATICVPKPCESVLDCPEDFYCEQVCVEDVCEQGVSICMDQTIVACAEDGSALEELRVCGNDDPNRESICLQVTEEEALCSCGDDWDCPRYMECHSGLCRGTGEEPSCTLPPVPFEESLPATEIVWGRQYGENHREHNGTCIGARPGIEGHCRGRPSMPCAIDSQCGIPYPESVSTLTSAMVANLTDDNGDGKIDERDDPEIIFMTSCDYEQPGVLRAIHGGGPRAGADYFAVNGPSAWFDGEGLPNVRERNEFPVRTNYAANCAEADFNWQHPPAIGDLDDPALPGDEPEIVVRIHGTLYGFAILDHQGHRLLTHRDEENADQPYVAENPLIALANIDGQGMAEIIIGTRVYFLERNPEGQLQIADRFEGQPNYVGISNTLGATTCIADLLGDERLEIVAAGTAFGMPQKPAGLEDRSDCADMPPQDDEGQAYCNGELMVLWQVPHEPDDSYFDGFCAIADVWGPPGSDLPGPDAALDGRPEVILVYRDWITVFNGETGEQLYGREVSDVGVGGSRMYAGPPTVDDFDGDGYPEVGTAHAGGYSVVDFQVPSRDCPDWPTAIVDGEAMPEANQPRNPGGACEGDADCLPGSSVCNRDLGECVCLHNGWKRRTQDFTSAVTGSTVFDFNGDGRVEVLYNDECYLRIYDGRGEAVLLRKPSSSGTWLEAPIVADVDNDGNAEFISGSETSILSHIPDVCAVPQGIFENPPRECVTDEDCPASHPSCENRRQPERGTRFTCVYNPTDCQVDADCPQDHPICHALHRECVNEYTNQLSDGLRVWGDPNDRWVPTRRIWNQHNYDITNVREDGQIPQHPAKNWGENNGLRYNSYRSQPKGVIRASDLVVKAIHFSSLGDACGALAGDARISALIGNDGEMRVGPDIEVGFYGRWAGEEEWRPLRNAEGEAMVVPIGVSLEPGRTVRVQADYVSADDDVNPDGLPEQMRVIIDVNGNPEFGRERECQEDNNTRTTPVEADASMLADLKVDRVTSRAEVCPSITARATISNIGIREAAIATVRFFAGDPERGGYEIGVTRTEAPLPPGERTIVSIRTTKVGLGQVIRVYAVVDPEDAIAECDETNNTGATADPVECLAP